jgi:hypothetical protein
MNIIVQPNRMGRYILYKIQSFTGSGEFVSLCMSIHVPPIKSLQASKLNLGLKRSTMQVARKTFNFGLNPDDYNYKCSRKFFITLGQTNWYKIKCMGLIKTS